MGGCCCCCSVTIGGNLPGCCQLFLLSEYGSAERKAKKKKNQEGSKAERNGRAGSRASQDGGHRDSTAKLGGEGGERSHLKRAKQNWCFFFPPFFFVCFLVSAEPGSAGAAVWGVKSFEIAFLKSALSQPSTARCYGVGALPWGQGAAMGSGRCHGVRVLPWGQGAAMGSGGLRGAGWEGLKARKEVWVERTLRASAEG